MQRERHKARRSLAISLFSFSQTGSDANRQPSVIGGRGMVGVSACPRYGTRIRELGSLSDSSYLEWEVSGGDGVGNEPKWELTQVLTATGLSRPSALAPQNFVGR